MNPVQYILVSSLCLSLFYLAFRLVFRNDCDFRQLRLYLLAAVILSLLLPLNNFRVDLRDYAVRGESRGVIVFPQGDDDLSAMPSEDLKETDLLERLGIFVKRVTDSIKIEAIIIVWIAVAVLLMIRLLFQVSVLVIVRLRSKTVRRNRYRLVINNRFRDPFSFFNWVFVSGEKLDDTDTDHIIRHEIVHARQFHSFDIILVELLVTAMWFNPFAWMMRKSIRLVHEYLADEGALGTGIDSLRYQALLVNQATEEKLICVSSSFNHSLIKKRMIMITKGKFKQKQKAKIITLFPVAMILLVVIALINGFVTEPLQAATPGQTTTRDMVFEPGEVNNDMPLTEDTLKIYRVSKKGTADTTIVLTGSDKVSSYAYSVNDSMTIVVTGKGKKNAIAIKQGITLEGGQHVLISGDSIMLKSGKIVLSSDPGNVNIIKDDSTFTIQTSYAIDTRNGIIISDGEGKADRNMIYILNDKEVSREELKKIIDDLDVVRIGIVNDKKQIIKYTSKDCDGVILIDSKVKK